MINLRKQKKLLYKGMMYMAQSHLHEAWMGKINIKLKPSIVIAWRKFQNRQEKVLMELFKLGNIFVLRSHSEVNY